MSIFSSILNKIFPSNHPAVVASSAPAKGAAAPVATPGAMAPKPAPSAAMPPVDVEQVLKGLSDKQSQTLNWQTSIVDLLKLLGLDSSMTARKALAQELHYTGDTNDSASMNIWLHRQVMTQLAANGGKVPENLKH